jgi:hypothetical protein
VPFVLSRAQSREWCAGVLLGDADTYSHVMPALGRDAADRMGRALWD